MTETAFEQDSDTRIFLLSALGSMVLHGMFMAGLVYMPEAPTVKDEPPTVQVTLLPAPESPQTPQAPTPPAQPRMATPKTQPPPMPRTSTPRPQPSPPPLQQASLQPPTPVKLSPLTPPIPTKSILKDTRASQAMKARNMMKMRVPTQARQTASALPNVKTRSNPVMSPMSTVRKKRSTTRALPAPATLATPKTLTATAPTQTASTMTRPNILSSSKPIYPRIARESGWEGTVIVRTLIDTTGTPSQLKIQKSCGHPTLDQAAQDAVQRWTFQPAKDGNIPISKWVDIPIKFDLDS